MRIFQKLPVLNLIRRPARSAALLCMVALLSFTVFGGVVTVSGLRRGLSSLGERLGADIMVIPEEAAEKKGLESIVLQGSTGYFYMDETKQEEIAEAAGNSRVTSQIFLASLAASCCSAKVQLIGFDPDTDYAVLPWIRKSFDGSLQEMEVVVGSDITSDEGDTLMFYDTPCTVAAKLTRTGTNYDRCVFAGSDTIRVLTQSSVGKNLNQFRDIDPNHVISCVLVSVEDGADIDAAVSAINDTVSGVRAVRTNSLIADTADSLRGISRIIHILIAVVLVLAFIILLIAFTMLIHERGREFAILRVLGVSENALSKSVWGEILLLCLTGALGGVLAAVIVTLPFAGALQGRLNMPVLMPSAGALLLYLLLAVLLAVGAGSLSAFWNVRRVCRADISLSLRREK